MSKNEAGRKIRTHQQYTAANYAYLKGKGYSDAEIIEIWDRDAGLGKEPIEKFAPIPDFVGWLNGKNMEA